jgi:hypothetical protein
MIPNESDRFLVVDVRHSLFRGSIFCNHCTVSALDFNQRCAVSSNCLLLRRSRKCFPIPWIDSIDSYRPGLCVLLDEKTKLVKIKVKKLGNPPAFFVSIGVMTPIQIPCITGAVNMTLKAYEWVMAKKTGISAIVHLFACFPPAKNLSVSGGSSTRRRRSGYGPVLRPVPFLRASALPEPVPPPDRMRIRCGRLPQPPAGRWAGGLPR